jgi:integrase
MSVVRIRGLKQTRHVGRGGVATVYWYAWRGGPRLPGRPGSAEFLAAYQRAVAARKQPTAEATLAGLAARYRAAPEFTGLAKATKAEWSRWLARLEADDAAGDIGGLPLAALDDRRARAVILAWRDQWADRPRAADYAIQVLSRVLAFGLDRGELSLNIASGVSRLYAGDRADQVWTPGELAAFAAAAGSPEVAAITALACLTGLRRADLCRLAWSHVGELAIVMPTAKSRGRRSQVIPLLPQTRALLADIARNQAARLAELAAHAERHGRPAPPAATTVLTNTRGRPWTPDGLEGQVVKAKARARPPIDKHLHDARGTFATRLRLAGLTAPEIADIMGWEEARVQRLLARYVDQAGIVRSIAERLGRAPKAD